MEIVAVSVVALLASLLTFFSGFGLGTILTPVMVFFFPIEVAIALTGVVHFTNNIFKLILVRQDINRNVLIRFGIPAIFASFLGAWLLTGITDMPVLYSYSNGGSKFEVLPVNLIIGVLLVVFAVLELIPAFKRLQFGEDKMIYGGLLSGFFGGLTGIQGAVRSAFLIKAGLSKEGYIATGVAIACLIDVSRLSVYSTRVIEADLVGNLPLLIPAILSAMTGALIGKRLLKKVTLELVKNLVAIMLIIIGVLLGSGII
ncbi:MAG: sulfite exporter TauE/SafE family protein [Ignavibacteriales bacterium]|nr:sulfite exporter TauE/SafE family protein [Ignavibacteriales bacterium]